MISPTHDPLFIALRAFILSFISGVEVVQGLGNGVPMPENAFIAITAVGQRRLATNETTYDADGDERTIKKSTEYSIQVDCYGPLSSDHATEIEMLWRDGYACDFLLSYGCQPLFCTDATQSALVTGEENYAQRWMLTAVLQFNPVTTVAQEFADVLEVDIVSVDATYPPL
jgi:hypothetical protein